MELKECGSLVLALKIEMDEIDQLGSQIWRLWLVLLTEFQRQQRENGSSFQQVVLEHCKLTAQANTELKKTIDSNLNRKSTQIHSTFREKKNGMKKSFWSKIRNRNLRE